MVTEISTNQSVADMTMHIEDQPREYYQPGRMKKTSLVYLIRAMRTDPVLCGPVNCDLEVRPLDIRHILRTLPIPSGRAIDLDDL